MTRVQITGFTVSENGERAPFHLVIGERRRIRKKIVAPGCGVLRWIARSRRQTSMLSANGRTTLLLLPSKSSWNALKTRG